MRKLRIVLAILMAVSATTVLTGCHDQIEGFLRAIGFDLDIRGDHDDECEPFDDDDNDCDFSFDGDNNGES